MEHVAIGGHTQRAVAPHQIVYAVHALDIHRQTFQTVGDLAGDRFALQAANLLEVSELRHFHAVEPNFPAQAPGAERRVFPVIFHEADVVNGRIQTQLFQRAQVQFLNVVRRWLNHHLELIVVLQTVRVFTVAAVSRTAGRLHVGGSHWLRPQRAQARHRVRGSRADFHVQWLNDGAALARPIVLQCQDQALKGLGIKLLHVEFARDTSGFKWDGPVYPLTVRYTARIPQQV